MKWLWTTLAVGAVGFMVWFGLSQISTPSVDNPEAQAVAVWLTDSGVKFYGAFWCPACNTQKDLFGDAAKDLPYVEASLPDRSGQTKEAKDANILRYPTWVFADGTRYEGVLSVEQLKEVSGYVEVTGPVVAN